MAQPLAMRLHLLGGGVERVVELVDGAAGRNLWLSEARFKCLVLRSIKDPEADRLAPLGSMFDLSLTGMRTYIQCMYDQVRLGFWQGASESS